MLQVFRDHSHKWFVKLLFWLLVLSFGLWGIGDIIYKFFNERPVIKVGKHSVSQEELAHHIQKETANIQEMTKKKMTPQEIRAFGVHTAIVDRLVSRYVITEELERMDLGISDDGLKDQIQAMAAFKTDGKFDANKFSSLLSQQGMSEANFIKEARFSVLSRQFLTSISYGVKLPDFYKKALIDSLVTEHIFTLVEINASELPLKETASTEQLQSYYDQYRARYLVPEHRNISVIILDNKSLLQLFGIKEEQVYNIYESQKDNFKFPERRNVSYIACSQSDTAKKIHEMAKKGIPLKKIASEFPAAELQEPGLIAKEQLPTYVADAVFSLKEGQSTNIIETDGGSMIFQVSKVEKTRHATYEEVKVQLETSIIQEQKSGKIEEIRSQIDDAIASGQSLKDVGAKLKLTTQTFNNINKEGKNAHGKLIFEKPTAMHLSIIQKAFATDQGLDSGFVDVPGEGAYILSVNDVSPARDPVFSDIEKKVKHDWENDQKLEAASTLASSIASQAKSLDTLVNLANKHNLTLSTNYSLSKLEIEKKGRKFADILPAPLAEKAFTLAVEKAMAGANAKGGYTVVMLQKVGHKKVTEIQNENLSKTLDNMIQEDFSAATISALKENHKIEINQQILSQMME